VLPGEFMIGSARILATKLANSLGMNLVHIEAGEFLMGTTRDQVDQLMRLFPDSERGWFDDEQPQRLVWLTRPGLLGPRSGSSGAVASRASPGAAARRTATGTRRRTETPTWTSAWPQSRNELGTEPSKVSQAGGEAEPTPNHAGVSELGGTALDECSVTLWTKKSRGWSCCAIRRKLPHATTGEIL
jgi:hypothetical protein